MLERNEEPAEVYTAEDAVEQMGFSCFQWKIIIFCSVFSVWHSFVIVLLCNKFY